MIKKFINFVNGSIIEAVGSDNVRGKRSGIIGRVCSVCGEYRELHMSKWYCFNLDWLCEDCIDTIIDGDESNE